MVGICSSIVWETSRAEKNPEVSKVPHLHFFLLLNISEIPGFDGFDTGFDDEAK